METTVSLEELRKKQEKPFLGWIKKYAPWFLNWRSLFWFFVFVFVLGILWMGYSLVNNSGTQLYGWDYSSQYTQFAYRFYDEWHYFFKTGVFTLYDPSTFFGTDNIGSNSYYGLFDPFVFLTVLFPRSAVPQVFAFAACLKGAIGALTMRAYLRYMGISEKSARVGATAFAYCGYLNFMVGFPSTVSMCLTVPLILLGIEKVIRERKPTTLIFGLFLLGIISFFFLVVLCIFGVLYALWRFFWTIKTRNAKENWYVIGLGIASFALGLMLCAWALLPSLRETSLSGRTVSIGAAYLSSLQSAFARFDIGTIFSLLFQMVGGNSSRELMGLVSFFYPTCNYLWLPLMRSTTDYAYDAWTASLFCYTPMVIFFIYHLITTIRKKDWENIIGFSICVYFVFTTFAYYFFYAFTGDGYGRWFIVLVPLIIREACKGVDEVKNKPDWQLPLATLLSCLLTVLTFLITKEALSGKQINWIGFSSYYYEEFNVPAVVNGNSLMWVVIYQICLVFAETVVIYLLRNKNALHYVLIGFIAVEIIVSGNMSFAYGSSWSYAKSYNGGEKNASLLLDATEHMNEQDDSFFRTYQEGTSEKNASMAFKYNGSSNFHSLFNYDVAELGRFSHIVGNERVYGPVYGEMITNKTWSGYYANKRADFDFAMGYKYYIIRNEGYGDWESDTDYAYNVPFGSKIIYQNERFRVYQSPYSSSFGHALDHAYSIKKVEDSSITNHSNFYRNSYGTDAYKEIARNEECYLDGAIFGENNELPQGFSSIESPITFSTYENITDALRPIKYTTKAGYGFHFEDPGSFLVDSSVWENEPDSGSNSTHYGRDNDKVVWKRSDGQYLNEDKNGAYFLLGYNSNVRTRIYMIGDTFDENGNIVKENVLLNYEYWAISNLITSGTPSYGGLYGFYAPGRVKAIVYCRKQEGNTTEVAARPFLLKQERSVFDERFNKLSTDKEYALTDVEYSTNQFSFKSNFSSKRICVTTLGYDEGWSVLASYQGESGEMVTEACPTYKLDGGFVGFLAPKGEVSYSMTYMTPKLTTGVALSISAVVLYFGYELTLYLLWRKKKMNASLANISHEEKATSVKPSVDDTKEDDKTNLS